MLSELVVKNLGVVASAQIVLDTGMTVVTGETGAGKTVVIQAVSSLCGSKVEPSLVRQGAEEAVISGRFVDINYREQLATEIVVRRVVPVNGRTRTYVDDEPVTLTQLSETLDDAVSLHGQHAHQQLLSSTSQRTALDTYGRVDTTQLMQLRAERRHLESQLRELTTDPVALQRERDVVAYQLKELVDANLEDPSEDEVLKDRDELLSNRETFLAAGSTIIDCLDGDERGAVGLLGDAQSELARMPGWQAQAEQLSQLAAQVQEIAREVRHACESSDDATSELEALRQRRLVLRDLRRKYGATLSEVIAFRESVRARVDELDSVETRVAEVQQRLAAIDAQIVAESAIVKTYRLDAAVGLAKAATDHLRNLAMPTAEFGVDVQGDDGSDVTFLLAPNAGQSAQPLAKAASGGELSRTMLALHQAILVRDEGSGESQNASARRTLIFDEVDAGVGGEAGEAIGVALAQLALQYQVIVITHLPQVAAFADSHMVVSKETIGTETTARVETLTSDQQVTELARMLAGKRDSDSARSHAVELLASARETKGAPVAAKTAKTPKSTTSTKTANPAKKSKSQ